MMSGAGLPHCEYTEIWTILPRKSQKSHDLNRATAFSTKVHVHNLIRVVAGHHVDSQESKASSADNEDSDQPLLLHSLIGVFTGHTYNLVGHVGCGPTYLK